MLKDRDRSNAPSSSASGPNGHKREAGANAPNPSGIHSPSISLPKGGGAIKGIGEKFGANPVTGTGTMSIPLALSPGRSGFGPVLNLTYDSGAGNGAFGFGWNLSLPSITRKTDKGLPEYLDANESDAFILSGAEDLLPLLVKTASGWKHEPWSRNLDGEDYQIRRYRPRIEGLFSRIERWTNIRTSEIHWRSITRDNITTIYGEDDKSRVFAPADANTGQPKRIFSWLISRSYDDKGNAVVYEYASEDDQSVDRGQVNERNRVRAANRYLRSIKYGNRVSRLVQPTLELADWMFEVVFDYDEGRYEELPLDAGLSEAAQHRFVRAAAKPATPWPVRPDPFSLYRSGFEIRTYRRCHRVLMFHHFPELGAEPCLVRATEFDYSDFDYSLPTTIEQELLHQGSTRFASFIRNVTQSGFVRDPNSQLVPINGVDFVTYLKQSMPPVEFEYSRATIQDEIRELDADSLENLPVGLDGTSYQWVDLEGEGISGILTEQANAWFYKPNLGKAEFGPATLVASLPALAKLTSGRQQLIDLDGDGQLDLVCFFGPTAGFYERTEDQDWQTFRTFAALPNVPWDDPNLRFVDLTGDGHADILITEDEVFCWYSSLAEDGFDSPVRLVKSLDEESGPRLLLADGTQSIYLADMSGDGLADIVRIRNGEICYWPNLGYGRFGAKVTMDRAPWFDNEDQFSQRRVRIADLDGSGTSDIIYLGRETVNLYFNQGGNGWSEPRRLMQFPQVDDLSMVMTADLLGNGTVCLIWSSPLPKAAGRQLRYLDLMGEKPHLLTGSVNNLGAETRISYAPSTKFYLADKKAGKPWVTRIPFPVHVVERVETYDKISGNRFVVRYAYHHGHFDGIDREFRGFGLVEQWDTEEFASLDPNQQQPQGTNFDQSSHVPPVLTRTWYHTGAYLNRDHVSNYFAGLENDRNDGEYYREPGLSGAQAAELLLDDTILPDDLSVEDEREACRALKGSMLRQETYSLDGSAKEPHPYVVIEQNFTVRLQQPKGNNRHSVCFTHPREIITFRYEREPADPRIGHALTLELDDFGNVLKEANIAYGRRQNVIVTNALGDAEVIPNPGLAELSLSDQQRQTATFITYTEYEFTKPISDDDNYRTPLSSEGRTYELSGQTLPPAQSRFTFAQILQAGPAALAIAYEESPTPGIQQKRLIEHVRTLYRRNDLSGALLPGEMESMALPFETYKLALTPGLISAVYAGRVDNAMLQDECRYVHSQGDANWWIPSGFEFYSTSPLDSAAQELAEAQAHFFVPRRYRDPFHTATIPTETIVTYDSNDLLIVGTLDPLGNRITAGELDLAGNIATPGNDYRVLLPRLVMDANRNRTFVAFDALGRVAGTAVTGKPEDSPQKGDRLTANFRADLTLTEIENLFQNPTGLIAATLLDEASARFVYDLTAYWREPNPLLKPPAAAVTLSRQTHVSDPLPAGGLKIQISFSYSDGLDREIQRKIPAEAGPAPQRDAAGRILVDAKGLPVLTPNSVTPRWVGSGWTVFNNKGLPIRQFEPYFTDTHHFEFDVRIGISPVVFHDPTGRAVATLHPNHVWEKTNFNAWRQETWDVCDTALISNPELDSDAGNFFKRLATTAYRPTWNDQRAAGALGAEEQLAAQKTTVLANTPATAHFDSLGRTFLAVAHNKFKHSDTPPQAAPIEEFYRSRIEFDIEGNERVIRDAVEQNGESQGRLIMEYDYDMVGGRIHQASMEAGARWMLNNVAGKLTYTWDSREHRSRSAYDQLQRPTGLFLLTVAGPEINVGKTLYGETMPNPEVNNVRGQVVRVFDQAGVVVTDSYDFKGNQLGNQRQLAQEYQKTLDWSVAVPLEPETYSSGISYDALNRPSTLTTPDQSAILPQYNEAGLLERLEVDLQGAGLATTFIANIDYDSKGRRTLIEYGNGARSIYEYDRLTLRLIHLVTTRDPVQFPDDCPQPPPSGFPGCQIQDLKYTYDPLGNVILIRDDAQQSIYFRNRRVDPGSEYTYDALYRVIEATGREHLGQIGAPTATSYNDQPRVGILLSGSDGNAMGRYLERYLYDPVGNFMQMVHQGSSPVNPGWTRNYSYNEASLLEPAKQSNRLTACTIGNETETYSLAGDGYDPHGNLLRLPQLQELRWDFADQLQMSRRQAVNALDDNGLQHQGERTWYVYNNEGHRVRKVTELGPNQIRDERIYLGGFEIYRRRGADPLTRETLHVMDDKQKIALVETRTEGSETGVPAQLIRYQCHNHLGSATLELDRQAQIISYEEFYPYGSSSYRMVRNQSETPNRYRYTGKERDEESGLYYYGARYYVPWLVRWLSCDPISLKDGVNLYLYVRCNPVKLTDPNGTLSWLEQKLDAIVNPENSTLRAVMDNFDKRGEALVGAPAAMKEIYKKEGALGIGTSVVKGVAHLVEDTSQAANDVGYSITHLNEPGQKEKLASRSVDLVLGVADIVTIFDGAGAAKNAGTGAMAIAKDVAAASKGGFRGMALVEGVVVTGGKALVKSGKTAEALGQAAKATGITILESRALSGGGTPAGPPGGAPSGGSPLPPVKKIPPGVGKEPLRIKPPEVTAKPKGGGARTAWDEGALADKGMTPRAAFPRSPLHHLIPQELLKNPSIRALLKKRGIDIDQFAVQISEGEHSAVHSRYYNKEWSDFFASNPNASRSAILKFKDKMKKAFGMGKLPEQPYPR